MWKTTNARLLRCAMTDVMDFFILESNESGGTEIQDICFYSAMILVSLSRSISRLLP
jgi:hypothetical protein